MVLAMNIFPVMVRDHNFGRLLPKKLAKSGTDTSRINPEFKPGTGSP
jgi:hypothetical protein